MSHPKDVLDMNNEIEETPLMVEYRKNQLTARIIGAIAVGVLMTGATFYHYVESLGWLDAFYFSTITLTTIGYGDIVPHTAAGKIFTMFYVIVGIGIIGGFANFLFKNAVLRRELKNVNKTKSN